MQNFGEWFLEQSSPERQEACMYNMSVCRRLGVASDVSPFSQEVQDLQQEIADYYRKWKD